MNEACLEIHSETFDEIVEDIKRRNLSKDNPPKLIIGTGLSIAYGVPGMGKLAKHLHRGIGKGKDTELKEMWEAHYDAIKEKGLEAGLANVMAEESVLVDRIKELTARYILDREEKLHQDIMEKNTGFSRLMYYLRDSVSVNNRIIDIMTPNYDRIIEIVCDRLGIGVITGFYGSIYSRFNRNILKKSVELYNCRNYTWVRLFKPHGSINWINENGDEYLINDYQFLRKKAACIEIVTPGGSKYKEGLINNTFRCMREEFNELLNPSENYSLLFYGYGFNDAHFDTALFDSFQKNVLILARDVKEEILGKALKRKNITVFYQQDKKEYMIYESKKYVIDVPLWNIDQFAEVFLG